MFGKTFSATLTFDATSGLPTGVKDVVEENILNGAIKTVTGVISDDQVVVGLGRSIGVAAIAYGSAAFAAKQKTGAFGLNPWAKSVTL